MKNTKNHLKSSCAAALICLVIGSVRTPAFAQTGDVPAPPAEGPPAAGQSSPTKHDDTDHGFNALAQSPSDADPKGRLQTDTTFEQEAAISGMAEIAASQVALKHTQDPKVRNLAQTIVSDHERIAGNLKTLSEGTRVSLPEKLDEKRQTTVDKLDKIDDAGFDKAYAAQMVSDHEQTIMFFERHAKVTHDKTVGAFIARSLPVLRQHLAKAKALYGLKANTK